MNWSEHTKEPVPAPNAAGAAALGANASDGMVMVHLDQSGHTVGPDDNTLFLGDHGELALDTRRALVQLLAGPSIDARRHSKIWSVLVRDERLIRRRLSELFLDLVIDTEIQIAFTRQADTGDLETPTLLRRAQLSFIDSILLLHLRQRLTLANNQGERAVISTKEMTDALIMYERAANTDHVGFTKRIHASIEKIKKHNILQKLRASEDRYEIAPTLKLLFSADEIQALIALYQRMASGESAAGTGLAKAQVDQSDEEEE